MNLKENGRFIDRNDLSKLEKKTLELINVFACATTRQICLFNPSNRILRLLRKRCPNLEAITLTIKFKDDYKNLKLQILGTDLTEFRVEPSPLRYIGCGNSLPLFTVYDLPFPKLKFLSVVSAIIDNKVFAGLHSLRCLTLSHCNFPGESYFESVSTILANLSCLEALHLTMKHLIYQSPGLSEICRFFEVLSERKTLRCLKLRTFISSHQIPFNFECSIDSFEIMTIGLGKTLCSLDIASINDTVVGIIAKNLFKLQFVNLSRNSEITDSGFASFSGHSCLEVVDITDCEQITYNAIAMTIDTLPRIKKLFVTDYPERTELDWAQFNQVRHRMNHLKVDIITKWTHNSRNLCRYCESVFH